jgi:hypothetical protein
MRKLVKSRARRIYQHFTAFPITRHSFKSVDFPFIEKIGATEDGQWTYIRFTKTVDGTEKVEWGWCASKFVKVEGETTDGEPVDPNTPPVIAPVK